ncbi:MAG: fibrobacter succinogenes major paralogous domain-containing protein [Flavobacteriia bacterium]
MKTNTKFLLASLAMILGLNPIIQAQTVTIGTQVWTTKNLDVSTFRNGDVIPQASTDEAWEAARKNKQPAWCYYDNDPKNGTKYGKLYNWYAVNDPRGLAPAGYHIPTDAEWTVLTDYLGGVGIAGKKMKSTSGWDSYYTTGGSKTCSNCIDWNAEYRKKVPCHTCQDTRSVPAPTVTHSGNGSNSSGFSGLPGGTPDDHGPFATIGKYGYWWSATEYDTNYAWGHNLSYNDDDLYRNHPGKGTCVSVRCVKD